MWFVYMILTNDDHIYTGITTDICRRWNEHSSGVKGAKFFRGRKPKYLLYLETGHCRSSASKQEFALKKLTPKKKWLHINTASHLNKVATISTPLPIYSKVSK